MADYDNASCAAAAAAAGTYDAGLRAYMLRVYNYMLVGLVLTGVGVLRRLSRRGDDRSRRCSGAPAQRHRC